MNLKLSHLSQYPAPLRLILFLVGLAIVWLPIAAPIALLVPDDNTVTILTMSVLFVEFLIVVRVWGNRVHGDSHIFRTYGLSLTQRNGVEWLAGVALGLVSLWAMFWLQGWLGWLVWQPTSGVSLKVLLEGLVVGLGVGFAEELVFRGWMLDELCRDYGLRRSLWINSVLFAVLHFLKPLPEMIRSFPQFPGLVLLGMALVWATGRETRRKADQKTARLGLPIGLHGGLVGGFYLIQVGKMVQYTQRVPEWVTGVDGNPLAGAIGLVFLGGIAAFMQWRSQRRIP